MTFALSRPVALMYALAAMVPAADSVSVSASSTVVANNAPVIITVSLDAGASYSVWGQVLSWDANTLELTSQDVISSPLGTVVDDSRSLADITASREVRTGGYYATGAPPYVDRAAVSGLIARFNFTRRNPGTTTLTVSYKDGSHPFGAVLIKTDGTERSPSQAASVVLTDPVTNAAPVISESDGGCGAGGLLGLLISVAGLGLLGRRRR